MLPVSIITGFLGSGKTTLLNRLLQDASLENSLVIINELGEVGIDHLLVSTPAENVRLLSNGCLCCEVKGDLVDTLTDVSRKRATGEIPCFDRILIETTGLADPVPVMRTIVRGDDISLLYRLDTVVAVVDAVHALSQLTTHDEMRKQVAVSDALLLSKTDLVASDALPELEAAVKKINGGAEVFPMRHGEIEPELLFGPSAVATRERNLARWLASDQESRSSAGDGNSYTLHARDIRTFTLTYEGRVSRAALDTWLSMLASFKGPQLLRVKGIVNVAGKPHVIHAVQTVIHEPVQLESWPTPDKRTRIVFIVRGLERATLEKSLSAFALADSIGDQRQFDPAAYARFREAAKNLI